MHPSEDALLARIQTVFDLGNPDQMKTYDDILTEKEQTKRLIRLGNFLLDILRPTQRRSPARSASRLTSELQYLVAVLQSLTSHPELFGDLLSQPAVGQLPRTFFED
jgi:hypothetical protein